MFYQIFLSLQVKRCAIVTYKHGIHELLNDLRLKIQELRFYILHFRRWGGQLPTQAKKKELRF